jgi:hypothetical protein
MKRLGIVLAASLAISSLLFGPARAQTTVPGLPLVPLGYCQIAAATLAASTPLSACAGGIPTGATMALLQSEVAPIRYRDDAVAPTTAVGALLVNGAGIFYTGTLSKLRFIGASGSPLLNVLFYR